MDAANYSHRETQGTGGPCLPHFRTFRPLFLGRHLLLGAVNAAPVFVFGDRHATFHADTNALGRGPGSEELLEDRHTFRYVRRCRPVHGWAIAYDGQHEPP